MLVVARSASRWPVLSVTAIPTVQTQDAAIAPLLDRIEGRDIMHRILPLMQQALTGFGRRGHGVEVTDGHVLGLECGPRLQFSSTARSEMLSSICFRSHRKADR